MKHFIKSYSSLKSGEDMVYALSKLFVGIAIFFISIYSSVAQTSYQLVWENTSKNIDKCYGSKTFIVSVKNNRTNQQAINGVTITPTFPAGVTIKANSLLDLTSAYVPNQNLSPAYTSGGITWDGTKFTITKALPYLATIRFSVELEASCSANDLNFLTNSYQLKSNGAVLSDVVDGSNTGSTSPYSVLGADLSIVTAPTNNNLTNVNVLSTFNQVVQVTNGGKGKVKYLNLDVDALAANSTNTPTITNPKVYAAGTTTPIGTATLKSDNKTIDIVLDSVFYNNMKIDIAYDFTVKNCNSTNRTIVAKAMCGSGFSYTGNTVVCKSSNSVTSLYTVNNVQTTISMTMTEVPTLTNFDQIVGGTRKFKYEIKNTGNNIAKIAQASIFDGGLYSFIRPGQYWGVPASTYQVITSSVRVENGQGIALPSSSYSGGGDVKNRYSSAIGACFYDKTVNYVIYFNNYYLQPGESVIIYYDLLQCDSDPQPIKSVAPQTPPYDSEPYISNKYYFSGWIGGYSDWDNHCGVRNYWQQTMAGNHTAYNVSSKINSTIVPAQVLGAKKFYIEGEANMSAFLKLNNISANQKVYQMDITLPQGVSYVPNTYSSLNGATLKSGYPSFNSSTRILSLRFNETASSTRRMYYKIQLETDGITACGKLPIVQSTFVADNINGTKPLVSQTMRVDTVDFRCDLTCTGIKPVSVNIERSNFGLPDNNEDGYPETNGSLDRSKIYMYHLRYGDKVKATSKSAICGNYARFQADQRFAEGKWKPVGLPTINLKRGSTNQTATVPGNITQIGTSQRDFIIQWSGNEPAGWGDYMDQDTIEVVQEYELVQNKFYDASNNLMTVKTGLFSSTTYIASQNTLSPEWVYNGPLKQASFTALQNLYLVSGFDINYGFTGTNNYINNGCDANTYGIYFNPTNVGFSFPYEYRPLVYPDEFKVTMPDGLNFSSLSSIYLGYAATTNNSELTPFTTVNGNVITWNLKGYRNSKPNVYPIESPQIRINYTFTPKERCYNVTGNFLNVLKSTYLDKSIPNAQTDSTITSTTNIPINTNLNKLVLSLTTGRLQEPNSGISTNKFILTNNSTSAATNNSWFYLRGRRGNASIINVKKGGVTINPNSNGVYSLGTIPINSSSAEISFDLSLNSGCAKDTIDIFYGNECNSTLPTDVINYSCKSSDYVTIGPVTTNFDAKIISLNEGLTAPDFCSQLTVEFEIRNTNLGLIKDISTLVSTLPGMNYVPNSVKYKFPSNSTGGWVSSSYNPVITGDTLDGINLEFAILKPSSGVGPSLLSATSMEGTGNTNANTILVQYALESKCGVSEGFPIYHNFYANKICGESLPTIYQASQNLIFSNLTAPVFSTNLTKSTIEPVVKNCATGNKLVLKVINLGPVASTGTEFIRVLLPEIVRFKSYNPASTGNKNAPATQPNLQTNSFQVMNWNMPANLAVGDSVVMEVYVAPNLNAYLPNSGNISITTGKFISSTCDGLVCDVFKTNGSQNLTVNVQGAPAAPEASLVQTSCSSAKGSITFLSPLTAGNSFSIDNGQSYSTSKVFSNLLPGTYYLKVKNDQSCETVATNVSKTIIAQPASPATPSITGGTGSYCVGQTTVLKSSSRTGNQWYKNGVLITGATDSTYTVSLAGTYTVAVTNSQNCSTTSSGTTIVLNALPATPTITGGNGSFCPGTVVLTSSVATSYQWYKDGVLLTGETNRTLNVTAAGRYTVIVTNASGCSSASSGGNNVSFYTAPAAPTISGGDQSPYCSSQTVILTSTGSNNQWYKDGVAIAGANTANYTVSQTGTYSVIVSNAFGCSTNSSNSKAITIKDTPLAPTISKDKLAPYCVGDTIHLSSSSATAYQWYKDGVLVNGATNASFVVTTTGDYQVEGTAPNGCVSSKSTLENITFVALPAKPVITGAAAGTYCDSQTITIQSSNGSTYQWFKNGVIIVGATSQTYNVTESGDYTVVVTNTSGCASEASLGVSFVVNTRPAKPVINEIPSTICSGNSISLSTTASQVTYQWLKDGLAISGATNATYNATQTGDYSVIITSLQNCASDESASVRITVNASPEAPTVTGFDANATHCQGQTITLTSSSATGNQWYKNGTLIPNETAQILTVTSSGTYAVIVSNSNSCSSGQSLNQVVFFKASTTKPIISTAGNKCAGSSTILRSNVSGNNQWYKNGLILSGATADTLVVTQVGNYQVKQVETSTQCESILSDALTINPSPTVEITYNNVLYPGTTIALCAPTSTTQKSVDLNTFIKYGVNEQAASGFTFSWMKNASTISGEASQSLAVSSANSSAAGTYSVLIKDKITECEALSSSVGISILPAPTVNILSDQVNANNTLCMQSNVTLRSQTNANGPYVLEWHDGMNDFDFQKSTATINKEQVDGHWISQNNLTQFSYKYYVTDVDGCRYSSPVLNFYEGARPTKPIISGGTGTYCAGDQLLLVSNTSQGNQWYKNGVAIVGETNDSLLVSQSGAYTTVISQYNCASDTSDVKQISIHEYPIAAIEQGLELAFNATNCQNIPIELTAKNQTIAGTPNYTWYYKLQSSHIPQELTETRQTNSVNVAGFYQVKVTVNGCSKTSEYTRIYEPPVLNVTSTQICQGDSVKLSASRTHGLSNPVYQWYRNGNQIVGATDTCYQVKTDGRFYVIVKNGSGSMELTSCSAQIQISTPGNPEPLFNTILSTCNSSSVNLTSLQPAAINGKEFEWWTGTASTRDTQILNPLAYTTAGTVYLWAKSGNACYSLEGAPVLVDLSNCCPDDPGRFDMNPAFMILYGPANVRYKYVPGTYNNFKIALVSKLDGRIRQISTDTIGSFRGVIAGDYKLYAFASRAATTLTGITIGAKVADVQPSCENIATYDIFVNVLCNYDAQWSMLNPEPVPSQKQTKFAIINAGDSKKIVATSNTNSFPYQIGYGLQVVQLIYDGNLQNFEYGLSLEDVSANGLDIYAGQFIIRCEASTLQLDGQLYLDSNNDLLLNGSESYANLPTQQKFAKLMDKSGRTIMATSEVSNGGNFSFSMDFPDGTYKIFLSPNDDLLDTAHLAIPGWISQEIHFTVDAGQIVENIYQQYNFAPLAMFQMVPRPRPITPPRDFDELNYTQTFCLNDANKVIAVEGTTSQSTLRWYTDSTGTTPLNVRPEANTLVAGTSTYFVSQVINQVEGPRLRVNVVVKNRPSIAGEIRGSILGLAGSSAVYRLSSRDQVGYYQWTVPASWTSNNSHSDTLLVTYGTLAGNITVVKIDTNACAGTSKSFEVKIIIDTDGDGVDDQTELADRTNLNDPCDFIYDHRNVDPRASWYDLDCDGDGNKNGEDSQPLNFCVGGKIGHIPPLNSDTYNKFFREGDCDGDGISNHAETNGSGLPLDFDWDGTPNYLDLDSDNDLIPDAIEGNKHVDTDDWANYQDLDSDNDGISDRLEGLSDSDKDGIPNYLDLDSDGDCIPDVIEALLPAAQAKADSNADKMIDDAGMFIDTNGNGWFDASETREPVDSDKDGIPDFLDLDSDNDCIPDAIEIGVCGSPIDTDKDGIPDYLDLDSDNDCIPDKLEVGKVCGIPVDSDKDGLPDYRDIDSDNDCVPDAIEVGKECGVPADTDKDGIPDYLDLDSDNDCIPDSIEVGTCGKPVDSDKDGIPDYLDLDSDGDCIPDSLEVGKNCGKPVDSDNDLIPDYLDLDSDQDCIPDKIEAGAICGKVVDTDNDGIPDYLDLDSDNDTYSDNVEAGKVCGNPVDTDKDNIYDFRDLDSDGDGIPDKDEDDIDFGALPDCDHDGIPNRIDPDFCEWFLPNGISPNKDGANDQLIIPGIRRLTKNRLSIFNRWGTLVFETENYKNDWAGELNVGSALLEGDGKLPDGTYYYVIEFYGAYPTKGTYVYINRQIK
ncbi:gliding motility-associated C-terminal domain-containing protein [Sandaracinomonas limnophila]|uniref:Gliding motility-associated C-terminal domain-containing protein n=1 Tax=Sandaracinomonas limnophila TaxID=1862386 RepID=A0A437PUS0_9BACT|nr:gliding motility-associated C-terminal domain-containing protein [Sandaracinomonas limnophila]RVU25990.1 gliding motility-associated C-terminal domain-containing protein [Sandaracinomonas limnophila]